MGSSPDADALIADALVAKGVLSQAGFDQAHDYVGANGGSIADALLRLNIIKELDFLRVFAELYSTRFVKSETLRGIRLDESVLDRVAVRFAERFRIFPIRWDALNEELTVAAAIPRSPRLAAELKSTCGAQEVNIFVSTHGAVAALIRRHYYRDEGAFAQVTSNGAGAEIQRVATAQELLDDEERMKDFHTQLSRISRVKVARGPDDTDPRSGENAAEKPTTDPEIYAGAIVRPSTDPSLPGIGNLSAPPLPPPPPTSAPRPAVRTKTDTDPRGEAEPLKEGKTVQVSVEALTIAALRREISRYRIAQEFHRRVNLEKSVDAMIESILSGMFDLLDAGGTAIHLTSGRTAWKTREVGGVVEIPRMIIEKALASRHGILTSNVLLDDRFDSSKSVRVRGVKSVMAVPLRHRDETLGVLYVDSPLSAAFTEDDLPLLDAIGAQAALLLSNVSLVAQVQREVETRVSLSRFLSQAAVEEVLSGRLQVNMDGHLAETTVLFVDIRRFTTISAQMAPKDVVRFLNEFFDAVVGAIERNGGIVDKFVGDSVMGLWGALDARPDDARNALKAALEMIDRGSKILVAGRPLEFGVGINTGAAVVGAIGSKRRLDYTAIGANVNLAARLCGVAGPGEVLATEATLSRAGPGIIAQVIEPVQLKGLDTPIVPYSVKSLLAPLQLTHVHA
jgi:adenylate cyclase